MPNPIRCLNVSLCADYWPELPILEATHRRQPVWPMRTRSNPKAIAEAIDYLVTHPEEAEQMGRNGQKAVIEQYNWGIEEQKLLDLYNSLAE